MEPVPKKEISVCVLLDASMAEADDLIRGCLRDVNDYFSTVLDVKFDWPQLEKEPQHEVYT
jgi:hypothetical protein